MDWKEKKLFNSNAGAIAVVRPYGSEIDFVRNPISGSAEWFFLIIREFIFTPFLKSKLIKNLYSLVT